MPGSPTDAEGVRAHPVAIARADYLWFADLALASMVRIVADLGDELANRRPPFPGANSPYVVLTHCLGVIEYWAGATVAGRSIERDRAAEFTASGPVGPLVARAETARERLAEDLDGLGAWDAPQSVHRDPDDPVPYSETKGAVLVHILEELFQHLGQMEITRDALTVQPMSADPGAATPIACNLDAGSLADRMEEWRALVATSVVVVEAEPTVVHLVLEPSEAALVAAVELAQREKQCCPFFDVTIDIAPQQRTLSLRVPDGAEEVMATFVAILTS